MHNYKIINDDCEFLLKKIKENSIDSCITDPPYGIGMEYWDYCIPDKKIWKEIFRILKPGSFCLSFCSPKLYHRLACFIEDSGFEIIDQIMWMTTTKMPSKNNLKPTHEPIVVSQKPFNGTLKQNVLKWGVGIIDIKNTRIPWDKEPPKGWVANGYKRRTFGKEGKTTGSQKEFGTVDANPDGRYPSNIIGEVLPEHQKYFYAPRVTRKERGEYNNHPTPKPISLMRYLVKLYCPKSGIVLDPFCGSGSTGIASLLEEREFMGIEKEKQYFDIAEKRIKEYKSYDIERE